MLAAPTRAASGAPPSTTDRLLEQVLTELQAIRAVLERGRGARAHLTRRDHEALETILPVIAATTGSAWFTAREVIEHESPGIHLVVGGRNAKTLGRLLQRANNSGSVAGFVVERGGLEVGCVVWRILATS